jgi:hypothetical protein
LARSEHGKADARYAGHCESVRELEEATAALAALESSVRAAHAEFHQYGSGVADRPDARLAERAELRQRVADAEWKVSLSAPAADRLELDTAAAVATTLEDRLPGLRHAVLVEATIPLCIEVQRITEELRDRYSVLCALTGQKAIKCALPALPYGSAEIMVEAKDLPGLQAAWEAQLQAITDRPDLDIQVPGTAPREPTGPSLGCFSRIRKAVRAARN